MKKLLAMLLAVTMVLSLAACGGAKTDEDITITWYVPGDKQADIGEVMEAASKITMEKIGVKLDVQFIDNGAFTERMNMNFASGNDEFDLCFTGYINPYKDTVSKDAYLELDEYIENSDIIKEVVPEYARLTSTYKGKIYALPNMQIMATNTNGLFVLESLAEEYGLKADEIKSLNDIEPFLAWVKEKHPEISPFRVTASTGGVEGEGLASDQFSGSTYATDNGDGTVTVSTPADSTHSTAKYELMRKWFEKGYIRADIASVTDDNPEFLAGKYATWCGVYKPGADAEHNANNPSIRCIAIQISDAYMPYNAGSTTMTAINARTKHPDEAFKVIELVNSDKELYNLLAFGIEGKHYNLDETGRAVLVENSGYNPQGAWKFGNVFNSLLVPGQSDDVWEETIAFNEAARKSPLMGFSFDPTDVRTEIAQIATVNGKYTQGIKGFEPLSAWHPKFVEELKAAGVEKVADELERQINEWIKNNR